MLRNRKVLAFPALPLKRLCAEAKDFYIKKSDFHIRKSHLDLRKLHLDLKKSYPYIKKSHPYIRKSLPDIRKFHPYIRKSLPYILTNQTIIKEEDTHHISNISVTRKIVMRCLNKCAFVYPSLHLTV